MALPTSRDITFTPLSPVPSAHLNNVQDAIITVNTGYGVADAAAAAALAARIGASGPLNMPLAPTAPDYHFSTPRRRTFSPFLGKPQVVGEWDTLTGGKVEENLSTAGAYVLGVYVESGETITILVDVSQSAAIAGGAVTLNYLDNAGVYTTAVASVVIAATTGHQLLTLVSAYPVVSNVAYDITYTFGAGAGNTKDIGVAQMTFVR